MADGEHGATRLPEPGEVLVGKYRIEKLIGQGGMGAVYVAQHEILHQKVAIKLLLPEIAENKEAVARFLNEARAAARIRNEHVAQVMDVGTLPGGAAYMVLEYLEGSDLSDLLDQRGTLTIGESADYTLQALEAVAQAHALGIIHRDLKPANLFLAKRQDGSDVIKVLDFGISKATQSQAANAAVTATRALLGSPGYMSPEQVRSSKNVDARTDIWSMGVILYRLLTGVAPFEGDNLGAVFAAILEDAPVRVSSLRPEVSPELEAVVHHCLERDRDKRFSNAAELAQALAPFATPEGLVSVDRVCRTLAVSGPRKSLTTEAMKPVGSPDGSGALPAIIPTPGPIPAPAASAPAVTEGGTTAASWSEGSRQHAPAKKKNTGLMIGVGAGAVMLLVIGALGMKVITGTRVDPKATAAPLPAVELEAPKPAVAEHKPAVEAPKPQPPVATTTAAALESPPPPVSAAVSVTPPSKLGPRLPPIKVPPVTPPVKPTAHDPLLDNR